MPIYKIKGKNRDGLQRYHVRINYIDKRGEYKQLTRTVYGKEQAKDLEKQLLQQNNDTYSKMTVGELNDLYIKTKRYELRESTLDKHTRVTKVHILPTFETVRLDKLHLTVLNEWKITIEQKGLAPKTKKNIYGELRALLNFAVKMEFIPLNPLLKVGNFKNTLQLKKPMGYYTKEEFKQFINAAYENAVDYENDHHSFSEWDYYIFFQIAFLTGLRKGEILALKWLDLSGNMISVTRSLAQHSKGEDTETAPKNRSSIRTVQIPLSLINILDEHRRRQITLSNFNDDFRICGGESCLRYSTLENRNIKFAKVAEIKKIRIHDFRHSHASLLAFAGINIQEVARRLGHADIEQTLNTYCHFYKKEEEKAVEILNDIV